MISLQTPTTRHTDEAEVIGGFLFPAIRIEAKKHKNNPIEANWNAPHHIKGITENQRERTGTVAKKRAQQRREEKSRAEQSRAKKDNGGVELS